MVDVNLIHLYLHLDKLDVLFPESAEDFHLSRQLPAPLAANVMVRLADSNVNEIGFSLVYAPDGRDAVVE